MTSVVELFADAANHHALKGVLVALRSRAPIKVTLVKRTTAGCVLPYLTATGIPGPIFSPNEIARYIAVASSATAAAGCAAPAQDQPVTEESLRVDQWLSFESDKLCPALAPLYSQRRFTDDAKSALKYLDGAVAELPSLSAEAEAEAKATEKKSSSSSSSSPSSSPSASPLLYVADTVVYSSLFPAFCKNGILKPQERAQFSNLNAWFANFEARHKAEIDAAHLWLGASEPSDFLRVRPYFTVSPPQDKPFYITTPIYYVNGDAHIGHVYTTLIADTLARYHKLKGEQVRFLTGTDEHGQKVAAAAEKLGKTPKEFCDGVSASFRSVFDKFGFKYDHFIRTTDSLHEQHVKELWQRLVASGDILLGTYEGWYCVSDEAYVKESDTMDGFDRRTKQPCRVSKESGNPVVRLKEDNFVFKLSKYQDRLLKWYKENPKCITPEFRRQEIIKFVEGGLIDLSVSRNIKSCSWGIPVPGAEKEHVIYVWLDALSNYLTYARAVNAAENGKAVDSAGTNLLAWDANKLWPADVHVIGKDILKFHAIYWPAFLFALDIPPPQALIAHGWWTKDGEKISKADGNTFDPVEKAQLYGFDALKFFLLKESPMQDDPDYSDKNMIARVNSELADTLGNLHLRCSSAAVNPELHWPVLPSSSSSSCSSGVGAAAAAASSSSASADIISSNPCFTAKDRELIEHLNDLAGVVDHYFLALNIQKALNAIFDALRDLNNYATFNEPWRLVNPDVPKLTADGRVVKDEQTKESVTEPKSPAKHKEDLDRLKVVLYVMLEGVRIAYTLLSPVLVDAAPIALDHLNVPQGLRSGLDNLRFGKMVQGTKLGAVPKEMLAKEGEKKGQGLFPRVKAPPAAAPAATTTATTSAPPAAQGAAAAAAASSSSSSSSANTEQIAALQAQIDAQAEKVKTIKTQKTNAGIKANDDEEVKAEVAKLLALKKQLPSGAVAPAAASTKK